MAEVIKGLDLQDGQCMVVVIRGPNAGALVVLGAVPLTLGRGPSADLLLNHVTVSRHHAAIRPTEGGYILCDLGSLNGTYLNGARIDEALLVDGDELQVGMFKLAFFAAGRGGC